VATYTFISEKAGESALGEALDRQFERCIVNQIISGVETMPLREKMEFLALKIFGVDIVHGSGYPKGKFTIEEADASIDFTLDPCGSGGRILRAGAYEPISRQQRWIEGLVNFLSRNAGRFLPDPVVRWSLPLGALLIMDRKPYSQGLTKTAHAWSFGRKNMPYYCCLCGKLRERLNNPCLEIQPPETKYSPCTWKIGKNYLQ
jgi:hypothetical protein